MVGSGQAKRRSISLAPGVAVQKKAASWARQLLAVDARDGFRAGLVLTTAFIFAVARHSPVRAEVLADTAEQYRPIMAEQIGQSLAGARLLRERITAGDVEGAKTAWIEDALAGSVQRFSPAALFPTSIARSMPGPMRYWASTRSRRSCSVRSRPMSSNRRMR